METKQKNNIGTNQSLLKKLIFVGVVAVLCIVWIIMEGLGGGKFTFNNNTKYKIEYMDVTFVNDEWQVSDILKFENILTNTTAKKSFDEFKLNNMEANIQLKLKFEGHPVFVVEAGYFNENFKGKINVTLNETSDGEVDITIKAKNGVISSSSSGCNETYTIFVEEGYIE